MNMRANFKTLVEELDREALEELGRSVASEMAGRRKKGSIQMEHIHPRMSPEEKERAAQEIARVMKDGDDA
jgi:hypothetical protein